MVEHSSVRLILFPGDAALGADLLNEDEEVGELVETELHSSGGDDCVDVFYHSGRLTRLGKKEHIGIDKSMARMNGELSNMQRNKKSEAD